MSELSNQDEAVLTRSERRSLELGREVAAGLDEEGWRDLRPRLRARIEELKSSLRGEPHSSNIRRWERLISEDDLEQIKLSLSSNDRDSIEMREVSPFSGALSEEDRLRVLGRVR